jgi:hypothetical protein
MTEDIFMNQTPGEMLLHVAPMMVVALAFIALLSGLAYTLGQGQRRKDAPHSLAAQNFGWSMMILAFVAFIVWFAAVLGYHRDLLPCPPTAICELTPNDNHVHLFGYATCLMSAALATVGSGFLGWAGRRRQ